MLGVEVEMLSWLWLMACGTLEPDWLEDCDCGADQVCTWGGPGDECQDIPELCAAALDGECDLDRLDDPCRAALCDLPLDENGEIAGTNSTAVECWSTSETPTERWIDCDAPLTF
jgi:hypothetical protein